MVITIATFKKLGKINEFITYTIKLKFIIVAINTLSIKHCIRHFMWLYSYFSLALSSYCSKFSLNINSFKLRQLEIYFYLLTLHDL